MDFQNLVMGVSNDVNQKEIKMVYLQVNELVREDQMVLQSEVTDFFTEFVDI
jgi:hypothetical protein